MGEPGGGGDRGDSCQVEAAFQGGDVRAVGGCGGSRGENPVCVDLCMQTDVAKGSTGERGRERADKDMMKAREQTNGVEALNTCEN